MTGALVVTGASGAVGSELGRRAVAAGWRVVVGYARGRDRADALVDQLRRHGGEAASVHLPLDDAERCRQAVEQIGQDGAAPAALALCGFPAPTVAPFHKQPETVLRDLLEAGVVGHHRIVSLAWTSWFKPLGGGHILAVSSAAAGDRVAPYMAGYVVAKAGMEAVLRAALTEYGRSGLRVSVVRPGYIDTPMLDAFEPRFLELARTAKGRFLAPSEVADALLQALADPPPPGEFHVTQIEGPQHARSA